MSNYYYKNVKLSDFIEYITTDISSSYNHIDLSLNTESYTSIVKSGVNINEHPTNISYLIGQTTQISSYFIVKSNEYTATNANITIPNYCKKINIILIGKGGNGATGGSSTAQNQQNQNTNTNFNNQNNNNNVWATGYTGGSGGGGAFVYISNIPVTPSANINVQIESTATKLIYQTTTYTAGAGTDGSAATDGTGSTTKSTSDISGNGSGTTSGSNNYLTVSNGGGGAGGAGGAGVQYHSTASDNPNITANSGDPGTVGQSGYCKIYWLFE